MTHVDFSAGEVCFVQLCHLDFSDNCGFLEKGVWSDSSHMATGEKKTKPQILFTFFCASLATTWVLWLCFNWHHHGLFHSKTFFSSLKSGYLLVIGYLLHT